MGNSGMKALAEKFVDKYTHSVVTIDRVDFSNNQLNFSSLVGLLQLVKAWKASEMIIADDINFGSETLSNILEAVDQIFFQSGNEVILKILLGSFLFAYKLQDNEILELLTKSKRIKIMYLIGCYFTSDTEALLKKQKLTSAHILGDHLSLNFLRGVISTVTQNSLNPGLVIDDPTLSDKVADEIFSILPTDISYGIILVVSATKVQGVIKAYSLCSELMNLEILSLIQRIRALCSSCVPVVPSWDRNLQWYGHKSEGIIETFVKVLLLLCKNTGRFQLKIGLIEQNTLIVHAIKSEEIDALLSRYGSKFLPSIYLSSCFISYNKWNSVFFILFAVK